MCAIPIHTFFTIAFWLFVTFLQIQLCNAAEKDSIFWLLSNEGLLRRNAPSGTVVQFDGPMRINPALSETNLVNLHVSEPFLLHQHFNITPSSSISAGQSFKLVLTRPLLPQYSMLDFIKLTIQAQIMPHSIKNVANEKQQIVMKIEEKEIKINLFGDADGQNGAAEKLANGMLHKRIHMKRDEKNCTIYKIEQIATRNQHFASPSYRLIGPHSKFFQILNEEKTSSSINVHVIKIHYNGSAKCAPPIVANDGKLQILASFLNSFGSPQFEIWSLETEETEEIFPLDKAIHFTRKEFNIEFQHSLHSLTPQLILLSELEFREHILAANNNSIEFKLEMNETIDGILNIHPQTGALSINDSERLLTLFQSNEKTIQIFALLLLNGNIMDRAKINVRIDEQNWKRPQKASHEVIKFERSIYAFAIDPYNLNKFGDGNEEQILIEKLETKPKLNEENENSVEFIISEGGGGLFKFDSANSNGSSKNSLIYSGPMSQFPRNYTFKVLLISNDEFIDTAIVHILIAGIGSSPPTFQRPFQRIIISKYNNDFFAESPQQNDSKELFTLSADDTDPDAHLAYSLEGVKCRNYEGKILPEFECTNAFLLSPNGTTGQWVLSLMENGSEQQQQIAEALMNISVRDEAHPLERQANTLVLLKFTQKLNATNENETNNNNGIIDENNNLDLIDQNLTLHLLDSMPVNSVIYSFGGLPPKMGKFPTTSRYLLSGQFSKYFSIGKESGILSIALPLRNIIGRHQLTINVLNNNNGKQIVHQFKTILEITSSNPKWHKMQNYYELEDGKFLNLGQEFTNTLNDIELLMPSISGTNVNGQIMADENGTLNFAPIFDAQFAEDRSSNFFAVFNKSNIDMSSIISIHREIPSPSTNSLSFSNMPISSFPSSSIRLPENSPIGTYVLSLDFNTPPQSSEFTIRPTLPLQINSTAFINIEKRANSILLRTNQTLKGIIMEQNPMEFILQRNGQKIGQFSLEILPITNCQPRFKAGQKLVLSIPEERISNNQQSADVSTQWFPFGTISAELPKTNAVKECNSIKYSIERIGRNEEDNLKLESAIQIDPHTGMISANPLILSVEDIFEGIPLTILAQSGPKYFDRLRIQLKIIRKISLNKNLSMPKFIGKSPILLEIEEGIPVGTLLTTLKAYSANGTKEVQKYRLEGPDMDLLEIDPTNGELKTKHELDYETLVNDRQLPLQMLAIAEGEEGGENAAEMEIRLNIIDINDNFPEFTNKIYDFVVEKDAPIGWQLGKVEAEDADPSTKNVTLRILTCDFHFGRFSRQIFPNNRIFKLEPSNGAISLVASVDDSTGGHFTLQLEAEDDGGRLSKQNGTVNIWVVHNADIVSMVIRKSAIQLDAKELNEYLESLSSKTNLKPILYEVRYHLDADGQPIRQSSVLQLVFLNQTHILNYDEAELALRDVNIDGMDGFEQNLFQSASSSQMSKPHSSSKNATNNANSHLLSLSLLFLFLLATILSVLGVLICQHRRRHIAERHLADALKAIRQSSISKSDTLDKSTTIHSPYYFLPPNQIGDIWRRPLPPPPILPSLLPPPPPSMLHHHSTPIPIIQQPTGTDGGGSFYTQHSHQNSDYYTVQEMKIAL